MINRVDSKSFKQEGNLVAITASDNNESDPQFKPVQFTVKADMTAAEKFQIFLDQEFEPVPDASIDGTFDIEWEWGTWEDTGLPRRIFVNATKIE